MGNRLGSMWLNRVAQLTGPTPAGRFSRFALYVPGINTLEPLFERAHRPGAGAAGRTTPAPRRQGDSLNSLLVEAFALVREAAKRTIGQRQFDVQIVGGIAIHNRCIAELETGEGKTLVATMPAFLNALPGKGVHVVTVNDYLARRDAEWMGPIYQMLGLTVGCIQTGQTDPVRRAAYACDITYGTAKELGFDFLRDELKRLQLGGDAHRKTFEQVYLGRGGARRVADARPAHPPLRDRRRGRQHPDRRGANAADHRGQQPADPGRGRRVLRRRPARRDPGPRQGLQVRPARAQGRADGRRPAQGPGGRGQSRRSSRSPSTASTNTSSGRSAPRSPISKTATTSRSTARSSSSTSSPAV